MHVSVIIPTRNRSRLLATSQRAVRRQRAVDLEVIVVDEASTDDTPDTGAVNIVDDLQIVYGRPPLPPEEVVPAIARYNAIPGGGSNVVIRRSTAHLHTKAFGEGIAEAEGWIAPLQEAEAE
jgi:glycosyltransferase involved in cell wall biosynthesis